MTQTTSMPRITRLEPIADQLQRLAEEHVPQPRTCEATLWDDGDYRLAIWHGSGHNEREGLVYDNDAGVVYWRRAKNPYWKKVSRIADGATECVSTVEVFDEREITSIEPPV